MPPTKWDISISNNDSEEKDNSEADTAYASSRGRPYDPTGKIDPFEPLIKSSSPNAPQGNTYVENESSGDTELEKIDLSQLQLTGIVLADSGNKALVRESSGKGHIVSTNTRIGTHGGRVAKVLNDRIIVKEKMKNVMGRFFFKETEIKLNRHS
jgi:Tfp pilus assembly protein PilP